MYDPSDKCEAIPQQQRLVWILAFFFFCVFGSDGPWWNRGDAAGKCDFELLLLTGSKSRRRAACRAGI